MGPSFLDNVNGCNLRMPNVHTEVPFSSASDAMFASLFTTYAGATLALFDDILCLLRHPGFRAEDLVIKDSSDLMGHISKHRQLDKV